MKREYWPESPIVMDNLLLPGALLLCFGSCIAVGLEGWMDRWERPAEVSIILN